MRMFGFMRAASVAALLTFDSGATLAQGTDLVTVTVVGSGANEAEARLDAIRQATQQVASQVIVAERLIADDEVVYDNVMSTMNGFVHDFTELSVKKSETEVQVEAEIIVSGNLMRDFAAGQASIISVDGGGMFGELLRSKSQAEVSQKMFESIWRRYADGMEAEIVLKEFDSEYANFDISVKWSDAFLDSLESFFESISYATCANSGEYWSPVEGFYAEIRAGRCVSTQAPNDDLEARWQKSQDERAELSYFETGTSFGAACVWHRSERCYLFDNLSIFPLMASSIEFYKQNVSNNMMGPVISQYYDKNDLTASGCTKSEGQPLRISSGTRPLAFDMRLSLLDGDNNTITTSNLSLPLITVTNRQPYNAEEHRLFGQYLQLSAACYNVSIPLAGIDLQKVASVSVKPVAAE